MKASPHFSVIQEACGMTPLYFAAARSEMELYELLLSDDYDAVNIEDNNGWTPLSWAARAHQCGLAVIVFY